MNMQTRSTPGCPAAPPPPAAERPAAPEARRASCPLCGRTFAPKKTGHTYCTRRCLFAAKRLERRRRLLVGAFGSGAWALADCPFATDVARLEGRRTPDPYWGF